MTIQAGGLLKMIHARYPGGEWAVLDELHDGTGWSSTRRFDAVAFNCWPSRGFVRLGFEIKVSRADFSKELAAHDKRAALEKHCHEVYFVVGPKVCEPREIPEPWGLLEVRGDKLHCTRKALHRKVGSVSETLAVCAIRRMTEAAAAEAQRCYRLDDTELTQEALDQLVQRKMSHAQEDLARGQMKLREAAQVLADERALFLQDAGRWWAMWRDLQDQANGWRRSSRLTESTRIVPPTRAEVDEVIARLRVAGGSNLQEILERAQRSLGEALTAMERKPQPEEPT